MPHPSELALKQQLLLSNRQFSQLSSEEQLDYCHLSKEKYKLDYDAYQHLKDNPATALEAATHLLAAYDGGFLPATDEFQALFNLKVQNTNDAVDLLDSDADLIFKRGICYLIGFGGYKQNIKAAFRLIASAAKLNYAIAQNYLGWMYSYGIGVAEDNNQACIWYGLAADQGNTLAQYNLGRMKEDSLGTAQNHKEAYLLLRLAAEKGLSSAHYSLGRIYEDGDPDTTPQDYNEAYKWYRFAAEQGHVASQSRLGEMLEAGLGVAQSDQQAARWFRLAGEQNYQNAIDSLTSSNGKACYLYHGAMLTGAYDVVIQTLLKSDVLYSEFLYDIHRSGNNLMLREKLRSVLRLLQDNDVDVRLYRIEMNTMIVREIINLHTEKSKLYEKENQLSLATLYQQLANITLADCSLQDAKKLIEVIVDSSYAAEAVYGRKQHPYSGKVFEYLSQLIFVLGCHNAAIDSHFLRQTAMRVIQYYYGNRFETNLRTAWTVEGLQLLLLIAKSDRPLSLNQLNGLLGGQYIVMKDKKIISSHTGLFASTPAYAVSSTPAESTKSEESSCAMQ